VPSDDVESVIVAAAKKLDKWDAEPWQVYVLELPPWVEMIQLLT